MYGPLLLVSAPVLHRRLAVTTAHDPSPPRSKRRVAPDPHTFSTGARLRRTDASMRLAPAWTARAGALSGRPRAAAWRVIFRSGGELSRSLRPPATRARGPSGSPELLQARPDDRPVGALATARPAAACRAFYAAVTDGVSVACGSLVRKPAPCFSWREESARESASRHATSFSSPPERLGTSGGVLHARRWIRREPGRVLRGLAHVLLRPSARSRPAQAAVRPERARRASRGSPPDCKL